MLHCVDAETGEAVWTQDLGAPVWGSPLCADGKLYVGTEGGDLYIMNAGREKHTLASISLFSPIYTTAVVANHVLYVTTGRNLYAISTQA